MCENSTANYTEKPQEPQDCPEHTASQDNEAVKFDIGEFVHTHRKLWLLTEPGWTCYQKAASILRWESPKFSMIVFLVCCFIALVSPVYFIITPLVYVSVVFITSGIRRTGQSGLSDRRNRGRTIRRKDEEMTDLKVKLTVEKQAKEDLKECIRLFAQMESLSEELCQYLEEAYRVYRWENAERTSKFLASFTLSAAVLWLLPWRWVMLLCIVAMFCLNSGFKQVFRKYSWAVLGKSKELYGQLGLNYYVPLNTRQSFKKRSFASATDLDEEWFDAQGSETFDAEDNTSDEEDKSQPLQIQRLPEYKSVVSRLVDYREKQKKLNSGNCSSCSVPFTSILKKRQYCRHCGMGFCSRCCCHRVKRAVFGATAPAAYEETVLVCKPCYDFLMSSYTDDKSDVW